MRGNFFNVVWYRDYMYYIVKKFKCVFVFYVIMKCMNLCIYIINVCDYF